MNECPFCDPEIIEKQKIYETETEYVFYNYRKTNKGRCLVIPKRHVSNINELTDKEAGNLIKTVRLVSTKLKNYLKPAGINYGFNEGARAGQVTSHFHFHILPRFEGDKVLQYHLFHEDPKTKSEWSDKELSELVSEFKNLFR